jgi:hypothetical protein
VFISDDYIRPLWNVPPAIFRCLAALPLCRVEDSPFFRLPPPEDLSSWIANIRTTRAPMTKFWFKARAKALLPASYQVYKYLASIHGEQQSGAAITELIRIYGPENVWFIHLPQKDEIDRPNDLGLKARRSIQKAGGKLFDGFKLCRLTTTDYYSNDGHPNRGGYTKIAFCVTNVIKAMIAGGRGSMSNVTTVQ